VLVLLILKKLQDKKLLIIPMSTSALRDEGFKSVAKSLPEMQSVEFHDKGSKI